jgi:hypothetical protein
MVEYIKSAKLPFTDWKKLGIGALLGTAFMYIPLLGLFAVFFFWGYLASVAKSAMKKKLALPLWDNWKQKFVIGAKIFLINICYLAIPMILMLIGLSITLAGIGMTFYELVTLDPTVVSQRMEIAMAVGGTGFALMLIADILCMIAGYFLPMALMNFISKGKVASAFNFFEVISKAMRWKYFVSVLFMAAYLIAVAVVAGIVGALTSATVIGPLIIAGAAVMVLGTTAYAILGQAYAQK